MANHPKTYLYKRIIQAKLYIDKNYGEAIVLDITAGEACFSKFHFIRTFKKLYGQTPHQYLIRVRVAKARELLQTGVDVQTVCLLVGFDSVPTFSSLFKKVIAQTPAQYQAARLSRENEITASPLKFIPGCFAEKNGFTNSNFQ